jgi:membrane protease YdiL (CAAX protease family)
MKPINTIKKINPLNNSTEVPTGVYIVKKLLAFFMIYAVSAVVGEVIIIAGLSFAGYDPLNGVMPTGKFGMLLPYYGNAIFILVTILYCKFIEKQAVKALGFEKNRILQYFAGALIAVVLLTAVIAVCCVTGSITYNGFNSEVDVLYIVVLLLGLVIQGATEEIMCRGFLMQSLQKKTSVSVAIFVSSTAFALPHLLTLLEADTLYAIVGIVNLYLVSIIFSLLMLCGSNIWISCGLHTVWNFLLYGVFGLTLSGSESTSDAVFKFESTSSSIINGGVYGVEASVVTTVILLVAVIIILVRFSKKESK